MTEVQATGAAEASTVVHGFCADEFAPVRDAFAAELASGAELGGSICLTVDGETVVDLWGGYADIDRTVAWRDDTLVNVARCLERSVRREDDLASRYGDTVFAVLLPTGGVRGAAEVSRLFRRHLADLAVPPGASTDPPVLTASIGIAVRAGHPGLTPASLVTVAEDALHRAEALGGNRTVLAPGSGCPPDCLGAEHRPVPPSVPSEVVGIPHR